ncbi:MAG: DegT/DnrJ/EryC1/StrS family aminotransferase [Dehalococcoidia bacterium]
MSVPFVDMARLHGPAREDLLAAFARVLDSGAFVQGREVESFEKEFAASYGSKHALAVSNGTCALHLALVACGVEPGDEVITVANTFIATAEAISMAGATPVFVDIEADGFNIDPAAVERAITPRTKAVIAVHLYGRVADVASLKAVTARHGLKLIEDACQAHGATFAGRKAGTFGDAGCLSFYPTKNLGTVGEGGMVLTGDDEIAARVASLRNHGQTLRHLHVEPGYNYRMPELQAAALRVLLPHLDRWNWSRVRAARLYDALLDGANVAIPAPGGEGEHVYHLYVVRTSDRDGLVRHLQARGIGAAVHYPTPIHLQPAYASARHPAGSLPRTEAAVREIVSLPMHPHLNAAEILTVVEAIRAFVPATERQLVLTGGAQ